MDWICLDKYMTYMEKRRKYKENSIQVWRKDKYISKKTSEVKYIREKIF